MVTLNWPRNPTKVKMLDTIDSLICCLRMDNSDIENLLDSQLEWKDIQDLGEFYYNNMWEHYKTYPADFKEDYYWEFVVED